jgi:hypothetical protein
MTVTIIIAITVAYLGTLGTIVVLLGGRISALEGRISALEAAVNHLTEAVGELRGRLDTLERTP